MFLFLRKTKRNNKPKRKKKRVSSRNRFSITNFHCFCQKKIVPFCPLSQRSGMEYVDMIYNGYGEKPNQGKIQRQGNEYLDKEFPLLSYISSTSSGSNKDVEEGH